MHEASLAQALLDLALKHAGGHRILVLTVRVGALSGVVTDSLSFYLDFLTQGTSAKGAVVHYERAPVQMECKRCGSEACVEEWRGLPGNEVVYLALQRGCAVCEGEELKIVGGYEFQLVDIEVNDRTPAFQEDERH